MMIFIMILSFFKKGFSDPYVEVRIASERKFTTSIKKKTLNPVWDEWVTLQMPRPQEILEIVSAFTGNYMI